MNRRNFLSIPAGMAVLWTTGVFASSSLEEKSLASRDDWNKKVYPYNKFTMHRVLFDKYQLPYAGEEDPSIHVLTSVTKEMCCDYSGFSFVLIRDGQPERLLTSREVIMIPREKS